MDELEQKISWRGMGASFLILAVIFLASVLGGLNKETNQLMEATNRSQSNMLASLAENMGRNNKASAENTQSKEPEKPKFNEELLPLRDWSVPYFESAAKAGVVTDIRTGKILYQKNLNERLPIASVTKLMTADVVMDNVDMSGVVEVSKKAVSAEGDYGNLSVGEKLVAKDLLYILLVPSSNDAAFAFADHMASSGKDLVSMMNQKAAELGLKDTHFVNPAGLDDPKHYSSAYDVAKILGDLRKKADIWQILRTQTADVLSVDKKFTHKLENTNKLLGTMDGIIGGKTGYTDNAKETLAMVVEVSGTELAFVVLGSDDRFADMRSLIEWTKKAYKFTP